MSESANLNESHSTEIDYCSLVDEYVNGRNLDLKQLTQLCLLTLNGHPTNGSWPELGARVIYSFPSGYCLACNQNGDITIFNSRMAPNLQPLPKGLNPDKFTWSDDLAAYIHDPIEHIRIFDILTLVEAIVVTEGPPRIYLPWNEFADIFTTDFNDGIEVLEDQNLAECQTKLLLHLLEEFKNNQLNPYSLDENNLPLYEPISSPQITYRWLGLPHKCAYERLVSLLDELMDQGWAIKQYGDWFIKQDRVDVSEISEDQPCLMLFQVDHDEPVSALGLFDYSIDFSGGDGALEVDGHKVLSDLCVKYKLAFDGSHIYSELPLEGNEY